MTTLLDKTPAPWRDRLHHLGRFALAHRLPLCLVGGSVRDLMLGREPLDWDVVAGGPADALVADAAKFFDAGVVQHPAFLTFTLHFPDKTSLDIATARKEVYPRAAALPVVEPADLKSDFFRRDFTVNAMALHVTPDRWGQMEDPFGGAEDLKKGLVRVLHKKSFLDDPTRLHRAARYAGRYGWAVDRAARRLIKESVDAEAPSFLSPARRRNELEHLLREPNPAPALKMLWDWGLWPFWSPRWKWSAFLPKALRAAPGGISLLAFRLMALCRSQTPADAKKDLSALSFSRAAGEEVSAALAALKAFGRRRGPIPDGALSPAALAFLALALKDPRLPARWVQSAPLLAGEDLKQMGYAPGPQYKKILDDIRRQRFAGRLKKKEDEARYILDNFPRKK